MGKSIFGEFYNEEDLKLSMDEITNSLPKYKRGLLTILLGRFEQTLENGGYIENRQQKEKLNEK
jgi:hypothetical protein